METKIRDMALEDYNEVKKLMVEVHKLHLSNRGDIYKESDPMTLDQFKDILRNDDSISILAEKDNKIVGIGMVIIKESPDNPILVKRRVAHIDVLCVNEEYIGNGIGRLIYNEIIERAKKRCIDSVELMVWSFNKSAISFYEGIGMKERSKVLECKLN